MTRSAHDAEPPVMRLTCETTWWWRFQMLDTATADSTGHIVDYEPFSHWTFS